MGDPSAVLLVTSHPDTADLYTYALEAGGYRTLCVPRLEDALRACVEDRPDAVIAHFVPQEDPVKAGTAFRQIRADVVLIGLFSMQLRMTVLEQVLRIFDDVILIPCPPDALLRRLERFLPRK